MKVRADGGEVVTKTEAGSHVHIKGGKQKREAASCHHGNTASLTDLECYYPINTTMASLVSRTKMT